MNINLRHVHAFLFLTEELHFQRAAARMHVSQPALSRFVRELEESIGATLAERTTRRVELTNAGRAFALEAKRGVGHLENAIRVARQAREGLSGELRLAYMDFAINGRLPDLLRSFRHDHPDIRLELSYMPTVVQYTALMEHKIDVGFMIGSFNHESFHSHTFDYEDYVALLPITHRLANARELQLSDLASEPFVLGNEDWSAHRERLFKLCHESGFVPSIVQEASSSEGIFGLVAAGTGVTVYAGCARNLQRRGLVIRSLKDIQQRIPVCAVRNLDTTSPSVDTFMAYLDTEWDHG